MIGLSGCEEANSCLAVCDHVSSGPLLQQRIRGPVLVGRPKVHTGLERRNWRLQDGRVGRYMLYVCFYSLMINALSLNMCNCCSGFLQELRMYSVCPVWSSGLWVWAGAVAVWRGPSDHWGRNHEHLPALDQWEWRLVTARNSLGQSQSVPLYRSGRYRYRFKVMWCALDTITSMTSTGRTTSLQHKSM